MRKAGVWAIYEAPVEEAWKVLTSREDVSWRSDLKKIQYRSRTDDYVEHSNDGYQLGFVVVEERPYEYYEIETWSNETRGRRMFTFESREDNTVRVILQEEMKIKPFFIEWLSRIFMPLEKILGTHLEDARGYIEMGMDEAVKDAESREKEAATPLGELYCDEDMPTEEELAVYDTDYLNADDYMQDDDKKKKGEKKQTG